LPYDSDEPPQIGELRNVIDHCCSSKSNAPLGVMPIHTMYYGGALAPIQEEKLRGISVEFEPEYS
jgi:hypothetical protein